MRLLLIAVGGLLHFCTPKHFQPPEFAKHAPNLHPVADLLRSTRYQASPTPIERDPDTVNPFLAHFHTRIAYSLPSPSNLSAQPYAARINVPIQTVWLPV